MHKFIIRFDSLADCKTNPCKNSGKCIVKDNDVVCNCLKNYAGQFCENSKLLFFLIFLPWSNKKIIIYVFFYFSVGGIKKLLSTSEQTTKLKIILINTKLRWITP